MIISIKIKKIKFGFQLMMLAVMASCSSDELGPLRDVAYFEAHEEERNAVIDKCDKDPSRYEAHPNCVNAYQANHNRIFGLGSSNAVPSIPPIEQLLDRNRGQKLD